MQEKVEEDDDDDDDDDCTVAQCHKSDGESDDENIQQNVRKNSGRFPATETQETCESIFTSTPPKIMNRKTAVMVMKADAGRRARQEPISLNFSSAPVRLSDVIESSSNFRHAVDGRTQSPCQSRKLSCSLVPAGAWRVTSKVTVHTRDREYRNQLLR